MENEEKKNRKAKETSEEKKALLTEDAALGEIASDKIFEDDPELARELAENRKIQEKAREYKELQEARKRQKRKRLIIIMICILIIVIASVLGYKYYQKVQAEKNSEAEVKVSDGQELVYAEIDTIVGNNITVNLLSEGSNGVGTTEVYAADENAEHSAEASSEGMSSDGANLEGKTSGDAQSSGAPSGDMPSGNNGGMEMAMGSHQNGSAYTETGETAEYQIPVGTSVITKLGTSATFTSLSNGDIIAIALEEGTDIIDKIWIVE